MGNNGGATRHEPVEKQKTPHGGNYTYLATANKDQKTAKCKKIEYATQPAPKMQPINYNRVGKMQNSVKRLIANTMTYGEHEQGKESQKAGTSTYAKTSHARKTYADAY